MSATTKGPQRVHRVEIDGYMGISHADISMGPTMVTITGRNGSGKSSVLNALAEAVARKAGKIGRPIRDGWNEARIQVHTGGQDVELIVTRTFKRKGDNETTPEIAVRTVDGIPLKRPADIICGLVGESPIDPLRFMQADAREQLATLRRHVQGVDWQVVDQRRREIYESRTQTTRDLARLTGSIDGLILKLRNAPAPGRSVELILADINARNAIDAKHRAWVDECNRIAAAREQSATEIARCEETIDRLMAELARAREVLGEAVSRRNAIPAEDPPEPPQAPDAAALSQEMAAATGQAVIAAERARVTELTAERDATKKRHDEMTAELENMDQTVRNAIAATQMPVEGLTLGEDGVLLDGVPFAQANTARRLAASVGVTMAAVPPDGLRVLWVEDGSLLDDTTLDLIESLAQANRFQIIVERVISDPSQAKANDIVLVAGEIQTSRATDADIFAI